VENEKDTVYGMDGGVRLHLVTIWHDHLCRGAGALSVRVTKCMWGDERLEGEGLCEVLVL
jgi:hypothetical protein